MADDAYIEFARELARREVQRSSLRLVASEVGISHVALRDFIADGNHHTPRGATRSKLLAWSEKREKHTPLRDGLSYYQGVQDTLRGIMDFVGAKQLEIREFRRRIEADQEGGQPEPTTPSIERAEAEAEVLRRLPALPPLEKKKGKRRA